MELIVHFAPVIILCVALFFFISHRRAEMAKVIRRAEWEREAALGRMTPAQRNEDITRRFRWTLRLAAQRLVTLNTIMLGLVGWFFFLAGMPAGGVSHTVFCLVTLWLSWLTRYGTSNGPAAKEARGYKVFYWGYSGRWLDLGFATIAAGVAMLTFQAYVPPFLAGLYLGVSGVVTGMLLRWGLLDHEPWNPLAKQAGGSQGDIS